MAIANTVDMMVLVVRLLLMAVEIAVAINSRIYYVYYKQE